jgi:thioredoxin reductase (NADPH)
MEIESTVPPATAQYDPADPYVRREQTFPELSDAHIERAVAFGSVETLPCGTILFERGAHSVDFFIILEGHVEIVEFDPARGGLPRRVVMQGPREFTGELHHFNDRKILVTGRTASDGRVARLTRAQFRRMMIAEPDIAEIVMRAFILRRVALVLHEHAGVVVIGDRNQADTLRIRRFLARNNYPARLLDPADPDVAALRGEYGFETGTDPVVVCGPGRVLVNPDNHDLGCCLGISERIDDGALFDVAVVGAGPAGLAAAVYAASEGLRTVVLECEAPGGQAGTSSKIENYLGFPTGISGQALSGRAQVQAQKFGARIVLPRRVTRVDCSRRPYLLELERGETVSAKAVVIATGARYRRLDHLPDFERFEGNGVHYAATAIEAGLCTQEEIVVVGGGNSAGQAALYLSRHAAFVHMLVRGEGLAASMSDYLISRIEASPRIRLYTRSEITMLAGERHLERVRWVDRNSGESTERDVANLFLMLGASPNTDWLGDCGIALDEKGFVSCGGANFAEGSRHAEGRRPSMFETSRPGVFAVGDVRAGSVKRVASAVGEGSIVVSAVHRVIGE